MKKKEVRKILRWKVILLLLVLLIFNTYAWFIYINTVRSGVELRVKRWDITFQGDEEISDTYITISVEDIFPGMPDAIKSVIVSNNGELPADISYEIVSFRCFETTYSAVSETGQYTPEELKNMLEEEMPFTIKTSVNQSQTNVIEPQTQGTVDVMISWEYEADATASEADKKEKDLKDTEYGTKAYAWAQNNDSAPIEIVLKLLAEQHETT